MWNGEKTRRVPVRMDGEHRIWSQLEYHLPLTSCVIFGQEHFSGSKFLTLEILWGLNKMVVWSVWLSVWGHSECSIMATSCSCSRSSRQEGVKQWEKCEQCGSREMYSSGLSRGEEIYIYEWRDLLWEIGSRGYGGWAIPRSAVCKVETQERWWCDSSPRPEAWEPGSQRWCQFRPEGRRRPSSAQAGRQAGSKMGWLLPASAFFYSGPQWIGRCPPHWGVQSTLLSPIQMLRPPGNTLADTRRNNVGSEHPLAQRSCHRKITITRRLCWCWGDSLQSKPLKTSHLISFTA